MSRWLSSSQGSLFGSPPAPAEFCTTSESVFDLANNLLLCNNWDPKSLSSPYMADLPELERMSDIIPFGAAEEADVKLDPIITGDTEGYINDGAVAVLDSESNTPMVK